MLVFQNSRHRDLLVTEGAQQEAAGIIVANDPDGQNVYSEICQVIGGIGASPRNDGAIAMAENQHGRFARYARNFSEDELVSHHVAKHGDGKPSKGLDDLAKVVGEL
jgi:hypothetical protein